MSLENNIHKGRGYLIEMLDSIINSGTKKTSISP